VIGIDHGSLDRTGTYALDQFSIRETDDIQGFVGSVGDQKAIQFFIDLQVIESSLGSRYNDGLTES
jgi:hypothetical protein